MQRRDFLAAGLSLACAIPSISRAQGYPDRPVRILQGFAAGGNADTIARVVGNEMTKTLGQPMVVEAQTGAGGQDDDLAARYAAAIQSAVTNNWNRPDSAVAGLRCTIVITQIPGGDLINVQVTSPCNADQVTRNSIESAVRKAAPLPYQGYEKVFQRSIRFNFRYDG